MDLGAAGIHSRACPWPVRVCACRYGSRGLCGSVRGCRPGMGGSNKYHAETECEVYGEGRRLCRTSWLRDTQEGRCGSWLLGLACEPWPADSPGIRLAICMARRTAILPRWMKLGVNADTFFTIAHAAAVFRAYHLLGLHSAPPTGSYVIQRRLQSDSEPRHTFSNTGSACMQRRLQARSTLTPDSSADTRRKRQS